VRASALPRTCRSSPCAWPISFPAAGTHLTSHLRAESRFVRKRSCLGGTIAADHAGAELGIFLRNERRARVMRRHCAMLRGEAECERHVEISKRGHLPVEPLERIWAKAVGPRQAGPHMLDPEPLHPSHRIVQPVVLEMKPLAQAECRGEPSEGV